MKQRRGRRTILPRSVLRNQNNSISFSIFWYSFMNYPRFLNNGCWYMDTTISIWKESQSFGFPLVIQEVLGEVVTKLKQNRVILLGFHASTENTNHWGAALFCSKMSWKWFSDLLEKLRNLASREGINKQKGPPQKLIVFWDFKRSGPCWVARQSLLCPHITSKHTSSFLVVLIVFWVLASPRSLDNFTQPVSIFF